MSIGAPGLEQAFQVVILLRQVISAVLAHYTRGMPPVTMSAGTKVPADYWGRGGSVRYSLRGIGAHLLKP